METGKQNGNIVELGLVLISVIGALVGQWLLINTAGGIAGSLFWFLVAGAGFVGLVIRRERPDWWLRISQWATGHRAAMLLLITLLLTLATSNALVTRDRTGGRVYWDVIFLWVASCAVYLQTFRWPGLTQWRERLYSHRRELWLVAGLMLLAALLRFLWLDRIPDVMNGDEGLHALFARGVLEGANANPFSTYYGSGSLPLFVAALGLKLFGYTVLATRITPAVGGVLGVGATYLLARRLFGPAVAFVAAGLVASLHSHIQFSRVIGVGYIHATLFASLGVYCLYSALETHNALRAALGGIVMGLWLYVYVDSRFVPAVILAWLLALLVLPRHRPFIWGNRRQITAFIGGYVVAAAPQLTWGFLHPDQFNARFSSDGTLWNSYYARIAAQNPNLDLAQTLYAQVAHAFLTITRYPVMDFYGSPVPLLDLLTGSLFWLALVYSLLHLLDRRHLLLNIWLWSGVLAVGLLTVPRSSDGYRLLIVFIPIVLLLGVVVEQLARSLSSLVGGHSRAVWGILAAFIAVVLVINVVIYFVQFAPSCRYSDRSSRVAYYVGTVLAGLSPGDQAVMLGNEYLHYGTHASAEYLNPGVTVQNVTEPFSPDVAAAAARTFIVIPERQNELDGLQRAYPGGQVRQIDDCGTPALYVYSLR